MEKLADRLEQHSEPNPPDSKKTPNGVRYAFQEAVHRCRLHATVAVDANSNPPVPAQLWKLSCQKAVALAETLGSSFFVKDPSAHIIAEARKLLGEVDVADDSGSYLNSEMVSPKAP